MPSDKNGIKLQVGDTVNMVCLITGLDHHAEFINMALETVEPIWPSDKKREILVNSNQVFFMGRPENPSKPESAISSVDIPEVAE